MPTALSALPSSTFASVAQGSEAAYAAMARPTASAKQRSVKRDVCAQRSKVAPVEQWAVCMLASHHDCSRSHCIYARVGERNERVSACNLHNAQHARLKTVALVAVVLHNDAIVILC